MLRRATLAVIVVLAIAPLPAQLRVRPVADETGEIALQLAFRKLRAAATFMMTTAHPDDENSALLAQMAYGAGLRTVLVTATRGDGGQNEIGPEIFDALAVLRTEELMAVHRFDGAEQLFTRAVDFGYSFSIDETYEKWGRDAIIGDYVRQIRTVRPDVVVGFLWEGTNGGLHHQASAHLTAEAFRAAGDPARYPEQIAQGLRPWQAKKFYYTVSFGGQATTAPGDLQAVAAVYDPVLGRTYEDIGAEARTMHKCQGTSQLPPLPAAPVGARIYHLQDSTLPARSDGKETSMLDGIDPGLLGLAAYAGTAPGPGLTTSLGAIAHDVDDAEAGFQAKGLGGAVAGLAAGLSHVRELRAGLAAMHLDPGGQFEIDFRLAQKERQFQDALVTAATLRIEAVADDPIVTPGQSVALQLLVANRGAEPVDARQATATGFTAPPSCSTATVAVGALSACRATVTIPADAKSSDIYFRHEPSFARYVFDPAVPFGVPFAPTPFRATFGLTIHGQPVEAQLPVEARYGTDLFAGEKRSELLVVPALSVSVSPGILVAPAGRVSPKEVRVTVRNNTKGKALANVRLKAPAGWTISPATVPVAFGREDEEATVRFMVTSLANAEAGDSRLTAEATSGSASFSTGYEVVEYPHIRRRLLFHPADATVKVMDVKVAPNVKVGYVMGAGDKVPDAIAQLNVPVTFLSADDLAWGDLSKYSVIMTGVRAYDKRLDLRANNQRLLDYVKNGGVLLLNYNRQQDFNQVEGGYGPFPSVVTGDRVTDENAPVRVLVPAHPVFTTPNSVGPATWANWVQERGTYFLGQYGKEYTDLVESEDPFPNNPGVKRGALVEAHYGKGRWVYIGLVLWRELPAGVPGAYQLLANLISLKAPTPAR